MNIMKTKMRPVIYIHGQLLQAGTKCVKALNYVDKNKRLTKTEIRDHLKKIYKHISNALGDNNRYEDHQTEKEREESEIMNIEEDNNYHKSIEGFELPKDF